MAEMGPWNGEKYNVQKGNKAQSTKTHMALHPSDCACLARLSLPWGTAPAAMPVYIVRCAMKLNGITWELNLRMHSNRMLSVDGFQHTLYASQKNSYALARHRREKVYVLIVPLCDGGSHMCIRVGRRRDVNLRLCEPPPAFLRSVDKKMTRDYAEHIRARQQIKRGVRLLLTRQDRKALLSTLMCMRYTSKLPALPREIREIVLSFLNMSHLPLTHAIDK
jgi:hypothetical protein